MRAATKLRLTQPTPTEHEEQSNVVQWWKLYATTKRYDHRLLIAVPNSQILMRSARNPHAVMAYLRAEGFVDGVPDLFLAIPRYHGPAGMLVAGLFLEMKRKGGKASSGQIEMADLFRRQGFHVVIAEGCDEAVRAIRGYLEA